MAPRLMLENAGALGDDSLGEFDLELVELGGRSRRRRRSFSGPHQLGQLGDVFGFLFGLLSSGVGLLAKIIGTPLDFVGQAASAVIDGLAGLVGQIPWVGDILAQVLVVGKVIINAALHVPETLLKALSNVIGAFAKLPEKQQKALGEGAVSKLMGLAKSRGLEKEARQALTENAPVVGGQTVPPAPATIEEQPAYLKVLAGIGFPAVVAGGAALLTRA